jgi:hypothetical protein
VRIVWKIIVYIATSAWLDTALQRARQTIQSGVEPPHSKNGNCLGAAQRETVMTPPLRRTLSVGLILAALTLAGCQDSPNSSASVASRKNLEHLAAAMFRCHDKEGNLPAQALYSKDGEPLLSWRVALLPFLGEEDLYGQFKLDEPWDGPNNQPLLERMPKVYAPPVRGKTKEPGLTFYQVFVGKDTPFNDKVRATIPHSFQDGTSDTFLIVEAGEPVPWTKPQDLPYDPAKPLPKLGGLFSTHFNFALADGTARSFPIRIPNEPMIRTLITPAGGEAFATDW